MRTNLAFLAFLGLWAGCQWQQPYGDGKKLYEIHCANCHMEDGQGLEGLIPPLAKSDYLQQQKEQLPCLLRHGMEGKITVNGKEYEGKMPANKELSEVEIANILNYVGNSWGNQSEFVSIETAKKRLESCK